jgi:hypothetical protein
MILLDAALDYAARGLPVFPVYPIIERRGRFACKCLYTIRCEHPGKHPMTRHGLKDASTDPAVVRERWYCAPDANIGIACSAECCALDVDPRHGGDVALAELERLHGPLPVTWTAKTGGGGWHYYFRPPHEVRNSIAQLGAGLDVRGNGGYVVAPPSRHISGNYYQWVSGQAPGEVPLAIMPAWLLAPKPSKPEAPPSSISRRALAVRVHDLRRPLHRVLGLIRTVAFAAAGQRNDRLFWACCRARDMAAGGELDHDAAVQAVEALRQAAADSGLTSHEIDRTITSAMTRTT